MGPRVGLPVPDIYANAPASCYRLTGQKLQPEVLDPSMTQCSLETLLHLSCLCSDPAHVIEASISLT